MKVIDFSAELENELIELLVSQRWDYHSTPVLSEEKVSEQIRNCYYRSDEVRTFLLLNELNMTIGMIRLFDLGPDANDNKETPLFDIRLMESERAKGLGTEAVRWITDFVFTNYPNKNRFEATTRADNIAMRRVLDKCGFVKEAHYRQAWPDSEGRKFDCAGYSILRSDWRNKTRTKVNFED